MRLLVPGSCALFLCLPAVAQADLKADLLSHAAQAQVTNRMMALTEKTHEPSRFDVDAFARHLLQGLGKRTLREADASKLASEIDAVFKSAGTSTVGFLDHISDFRTTLGAIGVPANDVNNLGNELRAIGRQVRGPEDAPVRAPAPAMRPFR